MAEERTARSIVPTRAAAARLPLKRPASTGCATFFALPISPAVLLTRAMQPHAPIAPRYRTDAEKPAYVEKLFDAGARYYDRTAEQKGVKFCTLHSAIETSVLRIHHSIRIRPDITAGQRTARSIVPTRAAAARLPLKLPSSTKPRGLSGSVFAPDEVRQKNWLQI